MDSDDDGGFGGNVALSSVLSGLRRETHRTAQRPVTLAAQGHYPIYQPSNIDPASLHSAFHGSQYTVIHAIYNNVSHAKLSRPDIHPREESRATLSLMIRAESDESSPESLSSELYLAVRSPWLC